MAALERFIHGSSQGEHTLPVLVRAGLAPLQFETIQPFLEGIELTSTAAVATAHRLMAPVVALVRRYQRFWPQPAQ